MTESTPERPHTAEPAEGDEHPGSEGSGRTPHPTDPAEGGPVDGDEPGIDPGTRVTGV